MVEAIDQRATSGAALRIVALGSPHGDDCVAWHATEQLQSDTRLAGVVERIATPWELIHSLRPGCKVLILDACRSGASVGTLIQLREDELAEFRFRGDSTHGGSISEGLRLARALGRRCDEVLVLAVEIDEPSGTELSDAGRQAVTKLVTEVRQILSRWQVFD